MADLRTCVKRLLGRNSRYLLEIYYWLRYQLQFRGGPYYCPCCGAHPQRFLPAGKVAATRCPRCDAHPRHRLLWLYLHSNHPELFTQPLRLLHLAPEFCFSRHFLKLPKLRYVTADLDSPLADCHLDAMSLPFPDRTFDVIFCNHVLEHVADDGLAMAELLRTLRPGGWALLQVPLDPSRMETYEDEHIHTREERTRHFGQHDHRRQYGADYAQRLSWHGFRVVATPSAEICDSETCTRCGLDPAEEIYVGFRPEPTP